MAPDKCNDTTNRLKDIFYLNRRGVVSTKKKMGLSLRQCTTCGDYHFKRICGGKDLKINLIVRQINQVLISPTLWRNMQMRQ
jgi:hypothetical protein